MDQQPKIPTLKDSQKPQVKVRGLEAGVTLFDRLKQFKKKDLAFILAGLGTLFMAPLAEHFMMSPESGDAAMSPGFGRGGAGNGGGIFGNGGSVGYDSVNGTAPGSAIGGGSDVITPLNVRDPSALVMGPGATQQPPTSSVAPATPPPTAPTTHSDSDLKDALAASARGVGSAAHAAKSLLPIPKIALNSSGLRGLGAVSGGSTATGSSGGISSNGLAPNRAAGSNSLSAVRAAPGYKGVARGQSAGGGGLEALKAAANNAGETMNRGNAATALDQTAAQAIPNGGGGIGGPGGGGHDGGDKAFGGNQGKDSKSTGESLEFMKQKAIQEANIARWAKEQEAGDTKLELLKLRNKAAETFADSIVKGASDKMAACLFKGAKSPACAGSASGPSVWGCSTGNASNPVTMISNDLVAPDQGSCLGDGTKSYVYYQDGAGLSVCPHGGEGSFASCKPDSDATPGSNNPPGPKNDVKWASPSDLGSNPSVKSLDDSCKALKDISETMGKLSNPDVNAQIAQIKTYAANMRAQAAKVVALRDAVNGPVTTDCDATSLGVTNSLVHQQNEVLKSLAEPSPTDNPYGLLPRLLKAMEPPDPAKADPNSFDPRGLPNSKTGLDAAITTASNDVKKIVGKDPELVPAVGPEVFQKVYSTIYRLPADQLASVIAEKQAPFAKVNEARAAVVKAADTVIAIQGDLDKMPARLDASSGPDGTVAKIVPPGIKISKDMGDQVFKDQAFEIGTIAPVTAGAGSPASGLAGLATTAGKDVDAGSTAFADYKQKITDAGGDPAAVKAVHDDATTGFEPTNGKMGTGMQSLNKARTMQGNELNELLTTSQADRTKLATNAPDNP